MSRLETGMLKIKRDWCDSNEIIYAAIQKNSTYKNSHTIDFIPNDKLPLFKLDAGLIEEIIQNLIITHYSTKKTQL
jgi:two-component system sensor histidine kinase KdpD